ncbi:Ran-specific GTPase-activating protein 30 [Yarrowia sp. B02]|nr:Ran-specific GTPase-activating protein 30 [Yarrowia sp. B02]
MEWLLAQAGATAVSFATRGGYSLATHYAVKTVKKYLEKVPPEDRKVLEKTRQRLETKILIISPAIDLIQLISARGNTSLSTTVNLTRELKHDILEFQEDMDESLENASVSVARVREAMELLLKRVEEAIPLIQLALTTSGACLSSDLPSNVSPARLLQAMDYVTQAEREHESRVLKSRDLNGLAQSNPLASVPLLNPVVEGSTKLLNKSRDSDIQIGPTFSITTYTTFSSSSQIAWKEDMARASLSLFQKKQFEYYLKLEENFNDGRYHDDEPRISIIDVSKVTRLFFSASGKLLEIEDSKSPVLVVKINEADLSEDAEEDEEKVTWLAIESWSRDVEAEEEFLEEDNSFDMSVTEDTPGKSREDSGSRVFDSPVKGSRVFESPAKSRDSTRDFDNPRDFLRSRDLSKYNENSKPRDFSRDQSAHVTSLANQLDTLSFDSGSRDSISLLEYLIRLLALQSNDQKSALEITDERLNLYLRDESRDSRYEQSVPAVEAQRTMSRPIAPDTPVVLGGRKGHVVNHVNQASHVGNVGHVSSAGHRTQNHIPQIPFGSVTRPTSAAPQTPMRNNQFSSFHTPNAKSAWEVDRVMRPSPLKRQQ